MTTLPIPIRMQDEIIHTERSPRCQDLTCPCHTADEEGQGKRFFKVQLGDYHGVIFDRSAVEVSLTGANLRETLDADEAYALWVFLKSIHLELHRAKQSSESDNEHRESAQARNATTQCDDGSWW